jgi:deoxyribodipyrimidine photo-lyase
MGAESAGEIPAALRKLADDARVTVRRGGPPDPAGKCVVYWMQRAQRGRDNHAVDLAVEVANALALPLMVYFAGIANFPHANLRHYVFLNQGLPDIEADLAERNITFILRNAPYESHDRLLGKFDRAWFDRPIFGKIRYMSGASTGRKFDSKLYIKQMQGLPGGKEEAEFRLR